MRSHGMSMVQVGARLGLVNAIGGFIGSYAGGRIADHLSNKRNDTRYHLWLPALAQIINIPLALLIYQAQSADMALLMLIFVLAGNAIYLGPTYGTTQSLLSPRERALGSALLLFIINLIGLGLGPLVTGLLSDFFRARLLAGGAGDADATAQGLVWALRALIAINLWAAAHFVLAAQSLRKDTPA
jgi:predicted MFS family arabinose efflux permease